MGDHKIALSNTVRWVLLLFSSSALVAGGSVAWLSRGNGSGEASDSHIQTANLTEELAAKGYPFSAPSSTSHSGPADTANARDVVKNQSSARITLNGQEIPLPPDGHVRRTIRNGSSETTIDVKVNASTNTNAGDEKLAR